MTTLKFKNVTKEIQLHIVLDKSSSMERLKPYVIKSLNEQIAKFKEEAIKSNIKTTLTITEFANGVESNYLGDISTISSEIDESSYDPQGMTALNGGIYAAVRMGLYDHSKDCGKVYVIVIITDGDENNSNITHQYLKDTLKTARDTGVFTLVAAGPINCVQYFLNLGFNRESITTWSQDQAGVEQLTTQNVAGTTNLYRCIRSGQTSINNFYAVDADSIPPAVVKSNLTEVTSNYKHFFNETYNPKCDIKSFISSKIGVPYKVGSGYYQLTKKEYVQDHKDIILLENSTSKLYTSDNIRDILRIPSGQNLVIAPDASKKYTIFVKSTSWNRSILPGTAVLLDRTLYNKIKIGMV